MKVLVSAYACGAGKGSEAGTGWNWAVQSALGADVWVITRANNQPGIEAYERSQGETAPAATGSGNIHWVYFDLPGWMRFYKRGRRGSRFYYHCWQAGAVLVAGRLHRQVGFDVAHHASFATYWLPTFLPLLNIPVIVGPVGGGERSPAAFRRCFGLRAELAELARLGLRALTRVNPLLRLTLGRRVLGLAATEHTAAELRMLGAPDVRVWNPPVGVTANELATLVGSDGDPGRGFRIVSIGRLVHWKGFELGLRAFARIHQQVPGARYLILGAGPVRGRLERVSRDLGLEGAVDFLGQVPRAEELSLLSGCDVLLHPSLHDPGAWVCIEAMCLAKPVVCLAGGGPEVLIGGEAGIAVAAVEPEATISALAEALVCLARDPALASQLGSAGRSRVVSRFAWDRQGERMRDLYREVVTNMARV